MNKSEIFNELENNGMYDLEEVKQNKDLLIVKFKYDFEDLELEGAESYANEEYEGEKKDDTWYEKYYLPYLKDMASDEVEDIMEEISEERNLQHKFDSYKLRKENYEFTQFIAAFYKGEMNFNLNDIILDN
ncbi:hypothetical protein [Clostridium sp.]|uniref:hypothetical protein n=1 Tax=Clostridium sp. TaxID=1506 RepID=UPI002FCB9D29